MRVLAIAFLALGTSALHADSYTSYNLVNVSVNDRTLDSITGTLAFDTTTGLFSSGQLTQTGEPVFSGAPSFQGFTTAGQYEIYYANLIPATAQSVSFTEFVELLLPAVPGSNGVNLCSAANLCSGNVSTSGSFSLDPQRGFFGTSVINTGQLAPLVASTPEPSAIALLATGMLGGVGVLRRRAYGRNR